MTGNETGNVTGNVTGKEPGNVTGKEPGNETGTVLLYVADKLGAGGYTAR